MSWNLWWRFGSRPPWRERQRGIAATLAASRPDLAGLQEVWVGRGTSQAAQLGRRLGMHHAVATPSLPPPPEPPESPDQAGLEVGVAVLSRWPIRSVRRHPLPAAHRRPAPVSLIATVDHPAGPLHVICSCVEWEPEFADDQVAQTRALAGLLTDPGRDGPLPVLLTGDLNATADSPPLRALTGRPGVVDCWLAGGGDPEAVTLSSATPFPPLAATAQIDRRIDYVLARAGSAGAPVVVRRAALAGNPVAGPPPSDHYAVVVDIEVPGPG